MVRVLVVEDDNEVAAVFQGYLDKAGYDHDRAATPFGAVLRMVDQSFDLVMLDLLLTEKRDPSSDPLQSIVTANGHGGNGVVTGLALRGLGYTGPIVIVTGGMAEIPSKLAEQLKIAATVYKPALPQDVLPVIAKLLI